MGEIEAAEKGKLPKLVEEKDIRGTFHNHTTASDGKSTLKEMVSADSKLGWDYIGISIIRSLVFKRMGKMKSGSLHKSKKLKNSILL